MSKKVFWRASTDSERWVDKGALETTASGNDTELHIDVDQTERYQTLTDTPWGGCFNERGWQAMSVLTDEERTAVVKSLFDDKDGLGLNMARTPIGSSDYAIKEYSYNETAGDYEMKHFSIEQDYQYLLPYIKEALKFKKDLPVWGSPWTPPSWIKKNNSLIGGEINDDPKIFDAYALYFAKYVQAYRKEGVNLVMVMPQNEPTMNTNYSSCVWQGTQLRDFIKNHLSPTFKKEGVDTDIWLGTFTDSNSTLVDPTLEDEDAKSAIEGVAFQWWGAPKTKAVYRKNTGLKLMQSETMCGNSSNDWAYAEQQFDLMKSYFEAGVNAYCLWNMVLEPTGMSTGGWRQSAPITVDMEKKTVSYNPQYHEFKHFTHYIRGGAGRIKTEGNFVGKIAFQNPDGENVLIVKNGSDEDVTVTISFNGEKITPMLAAHSINTFRTEGEVTSTEDATYTKGLENEADDETIIKLINRHSGQTLTLEDASFNDGARLIQWTNQGLANQQWVVVPAEDGFCKLMNTHSYKIIGVNGASLDDGATLVQWNDTGSMDHRWRFEAVELGGKTYYKVINRNSQKLMALSEPSDKMGLETIQLGDAPNDDRLWEVVIVSGGADLEKVTTVK